MNEKHISIGYQLLKLNSKFDEPYTDANSFARKLISNYREKARLNNIQYQCFNEERMKTNGNME